MNIDEYIRFDDINKQFTIPSGTYSYSDVVRVSVLNEKAKYKGKGVPFTAILPSGPLPSGILQDPYLFVGVKVEKMKLFWPYMFLKKRRWSIRINILKIARLQKR